VDRTLPTLIVAALTVLALLAMYLGWRSRQRRQSSLPHPSALPTDLGARIIQLDCLYAATTLAGKPLERIAVFGLGYPGKATVTVAERGVVLTITGEAETFIPAGALRGVGRATWTIDRAVESGGLVAVTWVLRDEPAGGESGRDVEVDTYLRIVEPEDPSEFIQAIDGRIAAVRRSEAQ
jgi:hypothetical protein